VTSEEVYPIKNLDDYESLLLSHPQERVVSIPKQVAELLDVLFRIHIEFSKLFKHGDVRGSPI